MNSRSSTGLVAGAVLAVIMSPLTIAMAVAGVALSAACAIGTLFIHALALAGAGIADCVSPERSPQPM